MSSLMSPWRKFGFFDRTLVSDPSGPTIPNKDVQGLDITCCTSGRGQIIFGDSSGFIHFADRSFRLQSFQAYEISVSHMKQMKQRNILITIGNDQEGINPTIKVWNLDSVSKDSPPVCVRSIKITYEGKSYWVSSFAVLENLSQLAVGLANGAVVLIRGDISRDRFTKQKILHKGTHPITGLGFREQGKATYLYVVSSDSIDCYATQGKEMKEELDAQGCELGCAILSETDQEMILGRSEAVYFYGPEGRGACFIFDGSKKLLYWFRNYLIIVGKDSKGFAASTAPGPQSSVNRSNSVNIYDLKNKFIGYSGQLNDVTHVISEWGSIFLVTGDRQIYQLEEKDTSTKLEMLFKKNLYLIAINLANSAQYDYSSVIEIFRRYGDHLYSKGDFDGAMAQYIKTIGKLEPSYVIRKFLDAQRSHNLTSYLQELHEKGLANADHTTLLLNCYTKDVKKLNEFIKADKNLNFDVETAIKVCRQANHHEHALFLANKFQQHEWYLKIQLENINDYNDALDYISRLDFFEAEKNMKLYGKVLVNNIPEATTNLLIKLCTGYTKKGEPKASQGDGGENSDGFQAEPRRAELKSAPEDFIHIFVNQESWLTKFLEIMIKEQPDSSTVVYNTLLELYLKTPNAKEDSASDQEARWAKGLELLKRIDANFNLDHALVLAKMYNFKEGILYLYEKSKLYKEIVQYYMDNNEYPNVLLCCKKYGDKDPNLWVHVLSYFAQKDEDCQKEIGEILNTIDKKNLLPPLQVIQILSRSNSVTLSVVKDYITRRIQAESQMINEDYKQIKKYQEDSQKMRSEIQELKTSAKIFQLMKCTACGSPLELPAIHFLCMHSFHQRCLGDNEKECPQCAPQNNAILERRKAYEQSANQHEQFFKLLEGSDNGFSIISEYFGRNIFNKVIILGDR